MNCAKFLYGIHILSSMVDLEYRTCPEGHYVFYTRENYAQDFSDGDVDVMTGMPMYESGLYCFGCKRPYGISKLKDPKNNPEK